MAKRMEEERKIEKLLRAYAKKRRADAGDPLKLHPARRRQLQEEARRREAKPDEDESLSLWALFRQQWAFLLGFALIIFFAAAMFLPALSSAKKKAQNISAMSNLKEIGVAAQMAAADANGTLPASLDALTNSLVSATVLTDPQSGRRFIYAAGGALLDRLQSNAVLAYSPEDINGRAVLLADGTVEYANRKRFTELTNHVQLALAKDNNFSFGGSGGGGGVSTGLPMAQTPAMALPPPMALAPATPAEKVETFRASNAEVNDQVNASTLAANDTPAVNSPATAQFTRAGSQAAQLAQTQLGALQNSFRNNAVSISAPAVLANFLVQQTGKAIRILDADGSVYDGAVIDYDAYATTTPPGMAPPATKAPELTEGLSPASNGAFGAGGTRTPELPGGSSGSVSGSVRRMAKAIGGQPSAVQNYFFRVAGINLTLKQNVVFTASLTVTSNNVAAGEMIVTNSLIQSQVHMPAQQTYENRPQSVIWSNARIAGTAVVSETNIIKIDATSP
jgi:hypothetical protein